jgi:hypothetical protein
MASVPGGYQPNTRQPASRRADFDLLRRIARLEILGGPDAGGTNEVTIGGLAPTDSSELWVASTGILYAKVDDEWVPVSSGTAGADEVWVGPTAPGGTNYELWYDPDAPTTDITFPEEVVIGPDEPTDEATELWVNTADNNSLYAKVGGEWIKVTADAGEVIAPNEVAIGPSDPGAEVELWYDTDAPAALTDDTHWSTAWGMIGYQLGQAAGYTLTTDWTMLYDFSVQLIAGRRYELRWQNRAITAPLTYLVYYVDFTPSSGHGCVLADYEFSGMPQAPANWNNPTVSALLLPTASGTYRVMPKVKLQSGTGLLYDNLGGWCGLFDIGPSVPAAPTLPLGYQMISGTSTYLTDAWGNATIPLPPGGKLKSAVAVGSQRDYPMNITANFNDGAVDGNNAIFTVRNLSGANAVSTYIGLSFMITFTY